MRNLGLLILLTAAFTPLAWVGVRALVWWGRRAKWGDALLDAVEPYVLPAAVVLALALAGLVGALFSASGE